MMNFRNGSDWVLKEAIHIDLHTTTHDPTRAGSYLKLPDPIKKSNCVLNITNDDNLCGLWCIIAHLFPKFYTGGNRSRNTKAYEQHKEEVDTARAIPIENSGCWTARTVEQSQHQRVHTDRQTPTHPATDFREKRRAQRTCHRPSLPRQRDQLAL